MEQSDTTICHSTPRAPLRTTAAAAFGPGTTIPHLPRHPVTAISHASCTPSPLGRIATPRRAGRSSTTRCLSSSPSRIPAHSRAGPPVQALSRAILSTSRPLQSSPKPHPAAWCVASPDYTAEARRQKVFHRHPTAADARAHIGDTAIEAALWRTTETSRAGSLRARKMDRPREQGTRHSQTYSAPVLPWPVAPRQ